MCVGMKGKHGYVCVCVWYECGRRMSRNVYASRYGAGVCYRGGIRARSLQSGGPPMHVCVHSPLQWGELTTEEAESKLPGIFARISQKEETKQGLLELYDFKQRFPHINTERFSSATSPLFQVWRSEWEVCVGKVMCCGMQV